VATPGLLCQPRVIVKMIVEKQMECWLAGETEVLGANLPQRHFCPSQNPTWPDPGFNPGRCGGNPATNHLSYGEAPACSIVPQLTTLLRRNESFVLDDEMAGARDVLDSHLNLVRHPVIKREYFSRDFRHSLQKNSGTVPLNRSQPFTSQPLSFPSHPISRHITSASVV
jgi:hypothetical protein